ncbi:hypothetical protein [Flectobacillus roseus]|uniref:hypothetical protein n=1 Tax=Flectobacillus roseus TaxID=502259 RepID=UPI0024B646D2|nr:hypothetical protein [Flectobacillus roseus]MDI9871061.1 hypothetical protein [Flectobacillus roseus]
MNMKQSVDSFYDNKDLVLKLYHEVNAYDNARALKVRGKLRKDIPEEFVALGWPNKRLVDNCFQPIRNLQTGEKFTIVGKTVNEKRILKFFIEQIIVEKGEEGRKRVLDSLNMTIQNNKNKVTPLEELYYEISNN